MSSKTIYALIKDTHEDITHFRIESAEYKLRQAIKELDSGKDIYSTVRVGNE